MHSLVIHAWNEGSDIPETLHNTGYVIFSTMIATKNTNFLFWNALFTASGFNLQTKKKKKEEESLREFCIANEMKKYPDDDVEKLCEVSRVIPNEKFHKKISVICFRSC